MSTLLGLRIRLIACKYLRQLTEYSRRRSKMGNCEFSWQLPKMS